MAPDHPEGYIMMGNLLAKKKKQYGESISYFQKALEKDPHKTFLYSNIANSYGALGEIYKAQEYFQKLRDYNVESPEYYYNKSIQTKQNHIPDPTGEIEEGYLMKCLSLNPLFFPALVNLSNLYGSRGEVDKSLDLLSTTINRTFDPEFFKIIVQRGMARKAKNLPSLALIDFLWAYSINPYDIFIVANIATCYFETGQLSQAAQFASEGLNLAKKQSDHSNDEVFHQILQVFKNTKDMFDIKEM